MERAAASTSLQTLTTVFLHLFEEALTNFDALLMVEIGVDVDIQCGSDKRFSGISLTQFGSLLEITLKASQLGAEQQK
jgi:hypothetical protein